MRVLQLIDSLNTGGAERVAVNIANALSTEINGSFLCVTRKEGLLKDSLLKQVGYLFLNKKYTVDFKAIIKLYRFIKKHKINVVHAHSTSFFLATVIKFIYPDVIIVWHDHYGNSEFLMSRSHWVLKRCSKYFSHIFCVNKPLLNWAKQTLKFEEASYLANVAVIAKVLGSSRLKGAAGKRIVCLANLRPQKDHLNLISAFKEALKVHPDWTLHCVGENCNDNYSKQIKAQAEACGLVHAVYFYGSKPDVFSILKQADIGVLSSKSEGLPLALLEYGFAKLAVVATKVGEIENVITHKSHGLLVEPAKPLDLAKALIFLIEKKTLRHKFAENYFLHIRDNYTENSQIKHILKVYKSYLA